jgi:DHA2 family multidrug resistance protein
MLDRGTHVDWFASIEIWIYGFVVLSTAWAAVIHFAAAPQPLFDRHLFANVNFVVALLFMVVIGMVMFATMALLPPMLQGLFGYDVIDTGMVLMPRGVGVLISMQLSGLLMRKGVDARWMVSVGFLIGAWSLWQMAGWSLEVDRYHIVMSGLIQGLGIGLVFIPLQTIAFATLPPHLRTDGSSLLNLTRSVGSSIGISVMMTLLSRNTQTSHSDLAGHITPAVTGMIDLSSLERFAQYGQAGLGVLDAMVTRQAAMIAYVDDYWLMMWLSLASVPMVLIMRTSQVPAARAGPPEH